MAITRIQDASSSGAASTKTVTISASGSGNLLVAIFVNRDQNTTVTSITDNAGNTYAQASGAYATNFQTTTDIWYAKNSVAGATTVTFNSTPAPSFNEGVCTIVEYSGVDTITPIDAIGSTINGGAFTTPAFTAPIINNNSNSVILSAVDVSDNTITGVANGSWVELPSVTPIVDHVIVEFFPGATGTFSTNCTPSVSNRFSSSSIAFQPASSTLTLSLSDSISLSDSPVIPSFDISQSLSDSVVVSDSFPQSFSAQSDFLAPVTAPVVEMLVNQLVPAHVKTYFKIVE
jgi:hypothetical protein